MSRIFAEVIFKNGSLWRQQKIVMAADEMCALRGCAFRISKKRKFFF